MCGGVGPAKMRLFHDCVLLAVQWKAGCRFCTNSPEHNLVLSNWNTCFWVGCWETHSFHQLARDSADCVAEMMQTIDRDGPVTVAFQGTGLARLSSVHCVPESPVSLSTPSGESSQESQRCHGDLVHVIPVFGPCAAAHQSCCLLRAPASLLQCGPILSPM